MSEAENKARALEIAREAKSRCVPLASVMDVATLAAELALRERSAELAAMMAALASAGPIHAGPAPGDLGRKFPKARQCVVEFEHGDGAYDLMELLVTARTALTGATDGT